MRSGFAIHERVLDDEECARLLAALAPHCHEDRAGARHLMHVDEVHALACDRRLIDVATAALNALADAATTTPRRARGVPFRATLFAKTARANWLVAWHQDTALPFARRVETSSAMPPGEFGPWSTKAGVRYAHAPTWLLRRVVALRVHLDASTAENGPLRVLPDTHRFGVLSDPEVAAIARELEPSVCLVPRGGVLAMSPLLIHASSKVHRDLPRRVLHLEYADDLTPAPGVQLAVA